MFNRSARPASLSLGARPAGEETETETEGTGTEGEGWGGVMRWGGWGSGRGHSFPRVGGAGAGVRREGSLKVEMGKDTEEGADVQVDDEKSSYIPRVGAHLGDANVYLESLGFVKDGLSFFLRFFLALTLPPSVSHNKPHRNPPSHNNRYHPRAQCSVPKNRRRTIYAR